MYVDNSFGSDFVRFSHEKGLTEFNEIYHSLARLSTQEQALAFFGVS